LIAGIAAVSMAGLLQAEPSAEIRPTAFAPPEGPTLVSRTLVRALPDGKSIKATRTYLIWFQREDEGWRIEGELRDVKVEAPPLLEQFAAIERNRVEPGMFPLRLDAAGRILPRVMGAGDGSRVRAAALGEMMIAGAVQSAETRNQASRMLSRVAMAANSGTAWPVDLFNPAKAEQVELREIALPDGDRGSIEIAVTAQGLRPGGLPAQVERRVTTILAGSKRLSQELWVFAPASP
jgi:hypothetical protein